MEIDQLRPLTKGLTQFKTVQIIENSDEPFVIQSLDKYVFCGVKGRITGIGFGNETQVLSAINETIRPPKQMRVYSVFIEGGDVQPSPKDYESLQQKKVLSLDSNTSKFMRKLAGDILNIPSDRLGFSTSLATNPNIINKLWEHQSFSHLNAIQWRGTLIVNKNVKLLGMRLISIIKPEVICHIQCIQDSKANVDNVSYEIID